MRGLKVVAACLVLVAVLALAGVPDDEYSHKQWVNTLMLQGNADTVVTMLLNLPSEPIFIDSSGQVVIPRAFFYRKTDERGNPNLAALFQISDSAKVKVNVLYNANK